MTSVALDPSIFGVVEKILIAITPIVVAYLSYRTVKKEKQDKKNQTLQAEIDLRNKKDQERKDKEISDSIKQVSVSLDALSCRFDQLQESVDIAKINGQLEKIINVNEIEFEYSRSLGTVVSKVAETLEHMSPNDTTSLATILEAHGKKEEEIFSKLHKMVY